MRKEKWIEKILRKFHDSSFNRWKDLISFWCDVNKLDSSNHYHMAIAYQLHNLIFHIGNFTINNLLTSGTIFCVKYVILTPAITGCGLPKSPVLEKRIVISSDVGTLLHNSRDEICRKKSHSLWHCNSGIVTVVHFIDTITWLILNNESTETCANPAATDDECCGERMLFMSHTHKYTCLVPRRD